MSGPLERTGGVVTSFEEGIGSAVVTAAAGVAHVLDGAGDIAEEAIEAIAEGMESLLGGGPPSKPPPQKEQPKEPPAATAKERHEARLRTFVEADQQQREAARQEIARSLGAGDAKSEDELRQEKESQEKRNQDRGGGISG